MKTIINSNMKIERVGNHTWKLIDPFQVEIDDKIIIVPKGFEMDGASVPRIFWSICPPIAGPFGEAACVHDFMYSRLSAYSDRKFADKILREIGYFRGANVARCEAVYRAVRLFGWMYFKKKGGAYIE